MDKLNILWTTTNKDTIVNMISLYANNSFNKGLWKELNVIIWGGSAKLAGEDKEVQEEIKKMISNGIHVEACLYCADQFGTTETLKNLGVEMKYMLDPLTAYLKNDEKILTF